MYVHGGRNVEDKSAYFGGFWKFNLTTRAWTNLGDWTKTAPPARNHHACALLGSKFYIFGGRDSRALYGLLGDLWSIDLEMESAAGNWGWTEAGRRGGGIVGNLEEQTEQWEQQLSK